MEEVKRMNRYAPYGPRDQVIIRDENEEQVLDSDGQVDEEAKSITVEFGFNINGDKILFKDIMKEYGPVI